MQTPQFLPNGLFAPSKKPDLQGLLPFCLAGLNSPWEAAIEFGQPLSYRAGENLYADSRYFYLLRQGIIQAWYDDDNGESIFHLFMREGMLFHEMIALAGIHKNDYVMFMEASQVIRFDRDNLFTAEFCHTYPNLILNMASSISRKGIIFAEYKNGGVSMEIINQVARLLYTGFLNINRPNCLTQENMARILKVHRSSIARVIKRLKELDIIASSTRNHLVIKDMEKLRMYAIGKQK